jgi:hypothetical protein
MRGFESYPCQKLHLESPGTNLGNEDERAQALREMGAEVVVGDATQRSAENHNCRNRAQTKDSRTSKCSRLQAAFRLHYLVMRTDQKTTEGEP